MILVGCQLWFAGKNSDQFAPALHVFSRGLAAAGRKSVFELVSKAH
jgi:hypothetical protein